MDIDEMVALLARTSNGTRSEEEIRAMLGPETDSEEYKVYNLKEEEEEEKEE